MSDKTILCFGDSNTHGTRALRHMNDIRRFPKDQRWPSVLAKQLGVGWEVVNDGLPSRTATFDDPVDGEHKSGLRVLPASLQTHRPVDLLIIMLGTNDVKARFHAPAIDIAHSLEQLAVCARTYGVSQDGRPPKVLFIAPVPVDEVGFLGEMFAGGPEKSRALPKYLSFVATRQNAEFLDLAAVADVDKDDGVHLTAEGQIAVGLAIAAKVKEIFPNE